MGKWNGIFTIPGMLLLVVFLSTNLFSAQVDTAVQSLKPTIQPPEISNLSSMKSNPLNPQLDKAVFAQKTKKLQIPFIANNGQVDKQVRFYANTFGGTVFVTKDGEIVYALPDVGTQCLASSMHSPKGIRDEVGMLHDDHVSDIMHPAAWIVDHDKPAIQNLSSTLIGDPKSGVAIKETLVGGRVQEITGNEKAVTKVNYFKGNDPSQWKTNISTYDVVSLGEVYDGIELKLKAYGSNVEKLFCLKPGADPQQIKVRLSGIQPAGNPPPESPSVRGTGSCPPLAGVGGGSGARGLSVNEHGELVAETELGPVKFTKPVAYQEIDGKRVAVSVEYSIQNPEVRRQKQKARGKRQISSGEKGMGIKGKYLASNLKPPTSNPKSEYGFNVASYDKSHDLIIDPLLASTYLGGSGADHGYSLTLDTSGNIYVTGQTYSTDFPTTSGAYGTSHNGGDYDVFVSKLDSGLTSLLASTYLGGSGWDRGYSLALDPSGNVYVTGMTESTNFSTTSGAYGTSHNGGAYDVFVSKLDGGLTSMLASTYLGGSGWDWGYSLALDTSGNVYVTGMTESTNFSTTSGAYDTSFNGGWDDVFVSKLDGGLTSMLASTYLGGSGFDYGYSLALDTSGNVYVTGLTWSTDFPTTSGAYDTSDNVYNDVFVSKLDGELTSMLASTYLGGSGTDYGYSLALDTSGNVYVTGFTESTDFPTTSGAYDTPYNVYNDVFVSKLDGGLTSLLASTYLGGSGIDYGYSLALDTSGNVYVTGLTESTDFPTTSGAYDTSSNGSYDVFVSKLDGGLTSLLASTYLGGSDVGYSLALDTSGNVYVTGKTASSDFPTTSGAYDTSYNGGDYDAFVSKLDSNLSASAATTPTPSPTPSPTPTTSSAPTVTTKAATNVTSSSATLNGTVNANGLSTYASFKYGKTSGSSDGITTIQSISGTSDTEVSSSISGLSAGTTYYYSLAAGSTLGDEMTFTTSSGGNRPTVTTKAATNVTSSSATLNGTVNANGLSTTAWFEYGKSSGSYSSKSSIQSISGSSDKTISSGISGLSAGTTYYYKLVAQNSAGTTNGTEMSFTATAVGGTPPTVTTKAATNVTSSSATLNGTVNANGLSTYASFKYGKTSGSSDGITTIQSISGTSDTEVSSSISGLSAGTTYYYSLAAGSTLGDEMTFTTSSGGNRPTVTTNAATNVTSSSATLNGTVNANGLSTTAWFEYGKSSGSYGSKSSTQSISGSSSTTISIGISGLSAGTYYFYRLVGQNSAGVTYGGEKSLSAPTDGVSPTVTTKAATNVTSSSATLNGTVNANGLSTTVTFKYGKTSDSYDSLTTVQSVSGSGSTTVSSSITGLSAGTTYYYTLVAQNSAGYSTGSEMSFTTSSIISPTPTTTAAPTPFPTTIPLATPTVETKAATNVTSNSATLNGIVNANGLLTMAWFNYGTTKGGYSSTTTSSELVNGSSDRTISMGISRLSAGTTYFYQLAAQNSAGTSFGKEMSFTTLSTTFPTPFLTPTATAVPTPTPTLSQSPPFGLTIITHGYQAFSSDLPTWVNEMAIAIANRFGGTNTIPIYTMKITKDDSGQIIAKDKDFVKVTSAPDFKSAGGAIIKVDWSGLSGGEPLGDCFGFTQTTLIGKAIFTELEKDLEGAWLQVPIHLIGHSRGASVNSQLAHELGVHGIWVDHFTTLDPQPVTDCGDFNVEVWENVLFADNDYRRNDVSAPWGEHVAGTYERNLTGIVKGDGTPCDNLSFSHNGTAHEQVHTYYHGTILESESLEGYDCIDYVEVQPEWYEPKYPTRPRKTGYYFSRIGKGDRYSSDDSGIEPLINPMDGLHYRLTRSSTNNRESLSTTFSVWPNVTFKPFADQSGYSDYEVKVGKKVVFTYYYQDVDSDNLDIVFALDDDTNPFNNSDNKYYKKIGSPKGKTKKRGTISAKTKFEWLPKYTHIGTHYVQIKATDADKQVRYDYLLKPINVKTTGKRGRLGD